MRIYKYPLRLVEEQELGLSVGSTILDAQIQGNELVLWALVDPYAEVGVRRTIRIYGTGWNVLEENLVHISTVQGDDYVWHVFEEK